MGAWGSGIFDDDSAYDYAEELASDPLRFFRRSFDAALAQSHVGFDESHAVTVSAAHIDALLNGTAYRHDEQETFDAWIVAHRSLDVVPLAALAVKALTHALANSALAELWIDDAAWRTTVAALRDRLARS